MTGQCCKHVVWNCSPRFAVLAPPRQTGAWPAARTVRHRLAPPGAGAPRFLVWSSEGNDIGLDLHHAACRYARDEPVPKLSLLCLSVCVFEQPDRMRCVRGNTRELPGFPTGCATSCKGEVNRLQRRVQSSRFLGFLRRGNFPGIKETRWQRRMVKSHFTDELKFVAHPLGPRSSLKESDATNIVHRSFPAAMDEDVLARPL